MKLIFRSLSILSLLLLICAGAPDVRGQVAARAKAISGPAKVIEPDLLRIGGIDVRLDGIDGLEPNHLCGEPGRTWSCGMSAAAAFRTRLGTTIVTCTVVGEDARHRPLGRCRQGYEDVGAWLVRNGWAVAFRKYSNDYVGQEKAAKKEKVGAWRGRFVAPWTWRQKFAQHPERYAVPRS